MTNAEMLQEVVRRRECVKTCQTVQPRERERLLGQLDTLEKDLCDGVYPDKTWELHELDWEIYKSDLRRELVKKLAYIMLAFEDMERVEPNKFVDDEQTRMLLYWWRSEGGREEYLGEITIEERRELEAKEREWREKIK